MESSKLPATTLKALEAYRVLERWSGATHIEGVVYASGLLFQRFTFEPDSGLLRQHD